MLQTDENATSRSLVKFFRCTNCIGEHVKSEPVSENRLSFDPGGEFFDSAMVSLSKRVQMV
ncbi:MAG: hypothetical protein IIB69_07195 [Proteobacteria bacterium]|nr:hypothetical protein [Pseudomonadota bacterium]